MHSEKLKAKIDKIRFIFLKKEVYFTDIKHALKNCKHKSENIGDNMKLLLSGAEINCTCTCIINIGVNV